jgi:hypothetical protein
MEESADSRIDGVVDELANRGRRQELILNCHAIRFLSSTCKAGKHVAGRVMVGVLFSGSGAHEITSRSCDTR